ncbi:oligosaccharide MFS transporter [Alteromonas sp. NFXS44]|uniref:oligosaccharide MFS transporter n=1 Tax=Alteromonas sp. NFXS44 TaxID=2818435 RepID=UPI0032E04824
MSYSVSRNYWLLSLALFFFFLSWSFSYALFPIWLNQVVGISIEKTGFVFSLNAISALFFMPFFGFIQDKLGLRRNLLIVIGGILVVSAPFFIFIYGPLLQSNFYLGICLGALFFSTAYLAGVGTIESYIERYGRFAGFEFGQVRLWGSLGWCTAAFFSGSVFNINPDLNFCLASISAFLFLIAVLLVKPWKMPLMLDSGDLSSNSLVVEDAMNLLKMKKFWWLALYVACVSCIATVYDQQFPIYFSSLFPSREVGNEMYGYLNSVQVSLEVGGMLLAPAIVDRIGPKNGLLLTGAIMAIRIATSGFYIEPLFVASIKLLHAAELPLMLISIFKYICANFDRRLSATLYLVAFQLTMQIVTSGLSIVAATMYKSLGFPLTYKLTGLLLVFSIFVSWNVLADRK